MGEKMLDGMIRKERDAWTRIVERIESGDIDDLPLGYVPDFSPRVDYKQRGQCCPYEHCIELVDLSPSPSEKSCPAFGHDCPGGRNQVEACKRTECPHA